MTASSVFPLEGGCDCRHVRYRMETAPLFVHCCHCRWCQRESGASFALNAMIEADRVTVMGARTGAGRHSFGERLRPEVRPMSAMPHCAVEQLRRRRALDPIRPGRHARPAGPSAPRHPHLHCLEAALGGHSAGNAGGAGILRTREALAGRKSCPKTGPIAQDRAVSGLPSDRPYLALCNDDPCDHARVRNGEVRQAEPRNGHLAIRGRAPARR